MSWFSDWMHPEKGYQDAQKELEKYYQQAQGYQQPFMNQGQEQYGRLQQYMNALQDPESLYAKWAGGYSESPAAKQAEAMAQEHGLNAASSMGLMGSTPGLQAIQAGTTGIGLEDRQNYLNDLMNKYMQGAGLSQGIYGTGANAAGQLGQNAMNMGQNAAGLKYGESSAKGDLFGNILGGVESFAGGVLAGPLGSKFGQMIGAPQPQGFNTYGAYSPGSGMPMYR